MSSVPELTDAIEALYPADLEVYTDAVKTAERGKVMEDALPWVVAAVQLPTPRSRSLAGHRLAGRQLVTTTIAGVTRESVRVTYGHLYAALEGKRIIAEGWSTSPIRELNSRPIIEDRDITLIGSNRHPLFTVIEWELTVSSA